MEMNTKMKITKAKLKQIIKEELEVTLTNEEAAEMFGEDVREQLEEKPLDEGLETLAADLDPQKTSMMGEALTSTVSILITLFFKSSINLSLLVNSKFSF